MSYTVDFSRDRRGRFNDINSFISIIYGSEALYVEDTLNEMQWLQYERLTEFLRNLTGSGVFIRNIDNVVGMYTHDNNTLKDYSISIGGSPVLSIANMGINIGGNITYINNINLSSENLVKGLNKVVLPAGPSSGERYDVVYVETWLEEVKEGSTLNEYGCEGGIVLNNTIGDRSRFPNESEIDRRVQIKSRIRVKSGATFDNNKYGLLGVKSKGGSTSDTILGYRYLDVGKVSNIFVSGDGDSMSKTVLRSVDGYCYGMALFKIRRTNGNVNVDSDIEDLRLMISNSGDLYELIKSHIGSRGLSHGLADGTTNGFLSKELYTKLVNIEENATCDLTGSEIVELINLCKDLVHADRFKDDEGTLFKVEDFEKAFTKNSGFNKEFGTIVGTVAEGNDNRFLSTTQKNGLVGGEDTNLHYHKEDRKWSNLSGVPIRFVSDIFTRNNLSNGTYVVLDVDGSVSGQSLGILPKAHKFANLGDATKYWNNIYGTTIYEDGSSLESRYAKLSSITQDLVVRDLTSKRDVRVEGKLYVNVGANINYSYNSKNYNIIEVGSDAYTLNLGNTSSCLKLLSKVSPNVTVGSNTYTLVHSGNDSNYVKYSGVIDNLTFDINTISVGDITKGIKWSGNSDTFSIYVEKYQGSEGHKLVIESADNEDDIVEIRNTTTTNGSVTSSTFSSSGIVSNIRHTFNSEVYAKNSVDNKEYKIIDNQARVWRAVYQDLAELWKKDPNCELEAGDVMIMGKDGLLTTNIDCDGAVVGVYSDTFGMCLGGEGNSIEEIIESGEMVPIGIAGKVLVKVKGNVKIGDLLVTSDERGKARALGRYEMRDLGIVFGKALEEYNSSIDGEKRIWMMIMNA